MEWRLGLDGGGTKTDLVAAAPDGRLRGPWRVAGTSLTRDSSATVAEVLRQGVDLVCTSSAWLAADCRAVCGGFSSAGDEGREATYTAILRQLLPNARIRIMTDAELTWHGATGGRDGILVIAGTGSIVWGRYQGRVARVGGEGPGRDPGSADDLGRKAVAAGILPTPMDGNFAALLPALVRDHGAEADGLFRQAARDLLSLVEGCAAKLAWSTPEVYLFGGTFQHVAAILSYFKDACPFPVKMPLAPPTQAALDVARALLP